MNHLPATLKRSFWIVFLILFTGCGPALTPPPPTATLASTTTPVPPTIAPTATLTPTPPPTETPATMATSSPAGTPEPTEPVVTVAGLRMAYIIDGNLYVQDSGGQPLQLTHSGADSEPVLSDDGQKLAFMRSKHPAVRNKGVTLDLYSINADGSQERLLVNSGQLRALATKYGRSSEVYSRFFVPGTHRLLFNTRQVSSNDRYIYTGVNQDLLLVDTDSGEFWIFFLPGLPEQINRFALSPNGQQLAVQRIKEGQPIGQIDLIGLDGKIIRQDIFGSMFPDDASRFSQDYLSVRWAADGSRLVAVPGYRYPGEVGCPSIWQYSMTSGAVQKTVFDPAPEAQRFDISPDGNWMVYTACLGLDMSTVDGIYLGNLRTGATRKLGNQNVYGTPEYYVWSPDNTHFYFTDRLSGSGLIGDNRGNMEPSCDQSLFLGWIDNRRYMCGLGIMAELGKTKKEWVIESPRGFVWNGDFDFDFVMLK